MPILVFLAAFFAADKSGTPAPATARCGSYCVYVALSALDLIHEPYSSFEGRLPPPPANGYSLDDLETFAGRFGAHTLALEADLESLGRLDGRRACIAYLDRHFVVVSLIDEANDRVVIIDPPRLYERTLKEFRKTYSRRALVVATQPITLPSDGASSRIALVLGSAAAMMGVLMGIRIRARRRKLAVPLAGLLALVMGGCRPGGEPVSAIAGSKAEFAAQPGVPDPLRIEPSHHDAGRVFATSPDFKIPLRATLSNISDEP